MTDRQLHYIIEIAKSGNLTAAAKKLYISQPSLSTLLAHVEAELGANLFDRSVSPLVLTYAGEKYLEAAKKILSTLDELQNHIYDIGESRRGCLRIGCGPQHSPFIIPLILPNLRKKYPEIDFRITEDFQQLLELELLAGNLDVLIYSGSNKSPMLKYEEIVEYEYVLFTPHGFTAPLLPVKDKRLLPCIDLHSLEDKNFVLIKKGHQLRLMQDKIFQGLNFKPKVILETDNWQTSIRMVESGIAFTILPNANSGMNEQNFNKYSLKKMYYRRFYLCYRQNISNSRIMNDFLVMTRQIFETDKLGA